MTSSSTCASATWSKGSQVKHQAQQHQPGVRGGTVIVGPVGLIFHQAGVGTPARQRFVSLAAHFTAYISISNIGLVAPNSPDPVASTSRACTCACSACCDSPAPRCVLRGGLIDGHAGGGEQRRAVLTVTETTFGVQHARIAQPESQRHKQDNCCIYDTKGNNREERLE